ncbi:MAG: DUF1493 family protein [Alphaproteobacteria bacterium]|nr:DUF1493 family protein [Alphaproteobacteria bacterium]
MSDVEERIKAIIAKEISTKEASIDPSDIKPDSTLEDLKIESIDLVQIMFAIEEEFDIYLAEADVGFDVENVGQVVDAVNQLIAAKETGDAASSPAKT